MIVLSSHTTSYPTAVVTVPTTTPTVPGQTTPTAPGQSTLPPATTPVNTTPRPVAPPSSAITVDPRTLSGHTVSTAVSQPVLLTPVPGYVYQVTLANPALATFAYFHTARGAPAPALLPMQPGTTKVTVTWGAKHHTKSVSFTLLVKTPTTTTTAPKSKRHG